MKQTWAKLVDFLRGPPAPADAQPCQALLDLVDADIDRHGIARTGGVGRGIPRVSPPQASDHTSAPARAVDLTIAPPGILSDSEIDALAALVGLRGPVHRAGPSHFIKRETPSGPSGEWFSGLGWSTLDILVTDPLGRRVGFDPTRGVEVNEIGADASYSGPGTTPQIVDIVNLVPGDYALTAVGTREGPFGTPPDRAGPRHTTAGPTRCRGPWTAIDAMAVRVPMPATGNQIPIPLAGPDRTVTPGTEVTLDGSGSVDPDVGPGSLGFAWRQTAGRPVVLSADVGAVTRFTPQVAGHYTFALVVSDSQDSSASSSVTITVESAPAAARLCSFLGHDRPPPLLDQDVFRFDGDKGERVVITLARNGDGASTGERATLLLRRYRSGA